MSAFSFNCPGCGDYYNADLSPDAVLHHAGVFTVEIRFEMPGWRLIINDQTEHACGRGGEAGDREPREPIVPPGEVLHEVEPELQRLLDEIESQRPARERRGRARRRSVEQFGDLA